MLFRSVISAMEKQPENKCYNIIGKEDVYYVDIIKRIKKVKKLHTIVLNLPYWFFKLLMNVYAAISKKPPFTAAQLDALSAGDYFKTDPWWDIFNVPCTPFDKALEETFGHNEYSGIVLKP